MTSGTNRLASRGWSAMAPAAVAVATAAFVALLALWAAGGGAVSVPWAPSLGIRLELALDGLAATYGLLATGIGILVFAYAAAYLPRHLAHDAGPASDARRFWPWMVLFMLAMVGLALAQDLILVFLFFDLTAVASYFLIAFDRNRADARGAALMALLITGVAAIGLLIGAVLLHAEYGTFSLPELFVRAEAGPMTTAACALMVVAALAKSAQVPFHFWLPKAMAAPTPVSAYLHSAAMVAAGVLVLGKVHPLIALDPRLLDAILVVGFVSIAVGGILALGQDELKQILAYSTISQYGYVVVLSGIGGAAGAVGAALYVVAHGLAKSALFMTAGAVSEATGESRLSRLGGLARGMPALAVASGVVAASLAALPLTLGFFKEELFFAAAWERSPAVAAGAVAAAALTLANLLRFWLGIFTGPRRTEPRRIPWLLVAPVVVLAGISLLGGILIEPFAGLAERAAGVTHGAVVQIALGYHLEARPENVMALAAYGLGGVLLVVARRRPELVLVGARVGDLLGPRRWYSALLIGLNGLSDAAHRLEVRDLRTSLAAILVPTGILAALGFAATPTEGAYVAGPISEADLPIIALLILAVVAAATAARGRGRLRPVLALSVTGFALASVYAVMGAPDVALVAVLIETVATFVFVAVFSRLPGTTIGRSARAVPSPHRTRNVAAGVVAGISAFAVIWSALSRPPVGTADAAEQIRLTPQAHGGDVVTVILADFRGLTRWSRSPSSPSPSWASPASCDGRTSNEPDPRCRRSAAAGARDHGRRRAHREGLHGRRRGLQRRRRGRAGCRAALRIVGSAAGRPDRAHRALGSGRRRRRPAGGPWLRVRGRGARTAAVHPLPAPRRRRREGRTPGADDGDGLRRRPVPAGCGQPSGADSAPRAPAPGRRSRAHGRPMNVIFALAAASLFGIGAFLLLHRDLVRLVLGVAVISYASVLTLLAASIERGVPAIYPLPEGVLSDPLSQAMALTAIVIGLAVTALLLVQVLRVAAAFESDELQDVADEEAAFDADLEQAAAAAHHDEEAAAR